MQTKLKYWQMSIPTCNKSLETERGIKEQKTVYFRKNLPIFQLSSLSILFR